MAHGNIFERLTDPALYTGVYAERFRSGPGINQYSDKPVFGGASEFQGHTNTNSDTRIRDISEIMRPHLHAGSSQRRQVRPRRHQRKGPQKH